MKDETGALSLPWPWGRAGKGSRPSKMSHSTPPKSHQPSLPPVTLLESGEGWGPSHGAQEGGLSAFSSRAGQGPFRLCFPYSRVHELEQKLLGRRGGGAQRETGSLFL